MGESRNGGIYKMMLEAAAGQFKGWAVFIFSAAQVGTLEDRIGPYN